MRFGSVCSGIEAASVAWHPLGFESAWFAEIEKFPSAILASRYPETLNLGDMRKIPKLIRHLKIEAPEILVGGTPCQSFSVAGMRAGMDDERGNLIMTYVEIANAIDEVRSATGLGESIQVWENVPGVLSSKDNAFGCFLGALAGEDCELKPPGKKWENAGCVFGPRRSVAWRILDAQYFGLAQRRKRVFVVASARTGFDPTKVLFEFDGVRRDSPPCREAGKEVAGTLASRANAGGFPGTDEAVSGYLQIGRTVTTREGRHHDPSIETLVIHGTQDPCVSDSTAFTLGRNNGGENAVFSVRTAQAVAFAENSRSEVRLEGGDGKIVGTLSTGGGKPGQGTPTIAEAHGVRRLMPSECERLQGFPEDYTLIPLENKNPLDALRFSADSPRYKALGNSFAVPVVRWLGERIKIEASK